MTEHLTLTVNGTTQEIEVDDPDMPLLYALRDELGMNNPRFGCGLGQCGACTVLINGVPLLSCLTLTVDATDAEIVTIEGIGSISRPHPLQTSFGEHGATQCGYCTPAMILTAKALLDRDPSPSEQTIAEAIAGNMCRCTGYVSIVRAIAAVVEENQ